ncbi:MAG: M48 family metalloprotease [Longimicrobiales bacterium]
MSMSSRLRTLAVPALLAASACAVNPATGERQLSLISESQEIQMGREADPDIRASMGVVDDPELQRYVSELGLALAAESERPDLPWQFTVIDDPAVNAFAVPGGFIYVTRGILAHFENEAELVGVLGHEIGHVTARHSVNQMSRQQLQQLGLGVGMIFSENVREYGQVLAAGLGLLNLQYSRGDETESDELGVRYMVREGYDPHQLRGVFDMLARVSGGEGRAPEWQSTHPYPENRAQHLQQVIAAQPGTASADEVDREEYLDRIDGMMFGPNPREGYFVDTRFLHPDLAFEITFPSGWRTVNQKTVVAAVSPDQDAVVTLQLAEGSDPESAIRTFLGQEGVSGGPVRRTGGAVRALFSATTQEGEIRGEIAFRTHDGALFQMMGYAPASRWNARAAAVSGTLSSFDRVTDRSVLDVQPWRLEIVPLRSAQSLRTFHANHPSPASLERLMLINRVDDADSVIPAGSRIKQVVGRPLP